MLSQGERQLPQQGGLQRPQSLITLAIVGVVYGAEEVLVELLASKSTASVEL